MWSLPFDYSAFPGQLPVNGTLKVRNVMFLTTATAKKVVKFDMGLTSSATATYSPFQQSGGNSDNAWGYVRDYIVDTATTKYACTDVYAVADAAVATANTRGDVTVIGQVTGIAKASAAVVKGQGLMPSMATIGNLAPTIATDATLRNGSGNRKIVLLSTVAETATTATGHFNGFGWGLTFFNGGAANWNIDT